MKEDPKELLLHELDPLPVTQHREKVHHKRKFIPWIPRMYWLFYRKPLYFLIVIPSMIPGTIHIVSHTLMGKIIDIIHSDDPLPLVRKYSLALFFYSAFCSFCAFINFVVWIRIGNRIGNKIKLVLFKSLMENEIAFFDRHHIGELLTLLSDDAKSVEGAFTDSKTSQARFLGQFISAVLVTFSLDWKLAALDFIAIMAGGMVIKVFKNYSMLHRNHRFKALARSITIADEAISNIRVVFSFNRQQEEVKRFDQATNNVALHDRMDLIYTGIGFSLSFLLNWATVAFILNLGCYRILGGTLSAGSLFALSRASFMGGVALRNFLNSLHEEEKAIDASERIFKIADLKPETPTSGGKIIPDFRGNIEFRNVWFKYPTRDVYVLKNVSFKVDAGEIVACVGHSGSGKSTIVQLLLRFYDVTEGEILLDGISLKELDPRWIHQVVGVVQQDPQLFAMSIKGNIMYSVVDASYDAVVRAAEISHADKFILRLPQQYETNVGEKGGTLSGGQRQRIAIARAVLKDPTILVTDEATSALDSKSEKKVQAALDEVMTGRTSIIIAHRLGTIRAAKMIYVFESGELVESGLHDELVAKEGVYYNLVLRQLSKELGHTTSEEQLDNNGHP